MVTVARVTVLFALLGLLATAGLAADTAVPAAGSAAGSGVLLSNGFEEGLTGWTTEGEAEFAADKAEHHSGEQSARITIGPGVAPHYQQLQHVIEGVAVKDRITCTVWVRTKGLKDGDGAYMVLEFLGAGGQRVDLAQSQVSRNHGKDGWDKLTAEVVVPPEAKTARIDLVLNSHGTAWFDDADVVKVVKPNWPDLGDAQRDVVVHTGQVVEAKFGGVGFVVFDHNHAASQQLLDEVLNKRWRELNPSFARIYHSWTWDHATMDKVADRLSRLQGTGSEIYATTWNPKNVRGAELTAYANQIADSLAYLQSKGLTNIKEYCMTNELCLYPLPYSGLKDDMPLFKTYHQALFESFKAHKLDIRLLANDAPSMSNWDTVEWATKNMDDITGVYGAHNYVGNYPPDDEQFYPWFLGKMQWGAGMAKSVKKEFILGEFGGKEVAPGTKVGNRSLDGCVYFGTPQEPIMAIQLAEQVIAAVNGGLYAMSYWTFADFPDSFPEISGVPAGYQYANKWGMFKWSGDDNSTRAHYYAYGLLTKFMRGPATVYQVTVNDPRLRVAAIQHQGAKTGTVAVVNRNSHAAPLAVTIEGATPSASFRKYVYDPKNVLQNPFGDLQDPAGKVAMKDGKLTDSVGPNTLTVYTMAYSDTPPAVVQGLKVEAAADGKGHQLTWQANDAKDFCYYRVYRSDAADFVPDVKTQIGSTIATTFTDAKGEAGKDYHYRILAVDMSGNVSK